MTPYVILPVTVIVGCITPDLVAGARRVRTNIRANRAQARYRAERRFDTRCITAMHDQGLIDRRKARELHERSRHIRSGATR